MNSRAVTTLIIILAILKLISSQNHSIECEYQVVGVSYSCQLIIHNPHNFDEFEAISGEHLDDRSNDDVTSLYTHAGSTLNVPKIICRQFPNLILIDLINLSIESVSDEAFSGCGALEWLRLWNNRIKKLPSDVFVNNAKLTFIDIDGNQLRTLHEDIFVNLVELRSLEINNNHFDHLPSGIFRNQVNLRTLDMSNCKLSDLKPQWFRNLSNLQTLNLNSNNFQQISNESFEKLHNLVSLDISNNKIEIIEDFAFEKLSNLTLLSMNSMALTTINTNWFKNTQKLISLYLNFNKINSIPLNSFTNLSSLTSINLWDNQLKFIRRNSFGDVRNLNLIDFDSNHIAALDRQLIDDAENLATMYFEYNLCANATMSNFHLSRSHWMEILENCFKNAANGDDLLTEFDENYEFLTLPSIGIKINVYSFNEIQIALTPFNLPWMPMIEILIGTANNTQSVIRRNQEVDVVTVPTPNIIQDGQWNGFKVTWANQVILVFREGEEFPFMVYTLQEFFPLNFYGLRTPTSRGLWFVLPIQIF